jgi:phosphoglycerate dehydrogenase-like enzyme
MDETSPMESSVFHAHSRATVLVTVELSQEARGRLSLAAELVYRPNLPPQGALRLLRNADALIMGGDWALPEGALEGAPRLSVIGVLSAGKAPKVFAMARVKGLNVIYAPDSMVVAQAEQVMAQLLAIADPLGSNGLAGKVLGLVGFGPVCREVARRARAFDLQVLSYGGREGSRATRGLDLHPVDLPDLLAAVDFLCIEQPGADAPVVHLGGKELQNCRPGVHVVSIGGLEAPDLPAALKALDGGILGSFLLLLDSDEERPFPELWHPELRAAPRAAHGWPELEAQRELELVKEIIVDIESRPRDEPLALEVVPLEQVLPHENTDPDRVSRLIQRFQSDSTLINPPLVAPTESGYVLLDGATRLAALKALGFATLIVQLVDAQDPALTLGTWNHALQDLSPSSLMNLLEVLPGCSLTAISPARLRPALAASEALCAITTRDGDAYLVRATDNTRNLGRLNDIVATYTHAARVKRLAGDDFSALDRKAPGFSAIVRFPPFTVGEVIQATLQGQRIPQGITRFVVPGRVLHLHADLERLKADESLDVKRRWLRELVAERYARHAVRYYPEPVTLMDE